jgi:hypothetical protein
MDDTTSVFWVGSNLSQPVHLQGTVTFLEQLIDPRPRAGSASQM